ncbi:MAG: molybdate ABC transporter substrate-binding protein [Sulfurimonas sp. RIFOXYD12_FULL_33_39]|uniref:molybdate ABC transporter substrate-binding protein n=1 Tax=unclassified Sulfurimonas TaxID=2623549 RepID=UPI0008B0AFAA|nr:MULTISPECIES: molybdate ABC transporter substrate-binding protein [unclassified Sulfurimonas]OHE06886.1 MAG: molybdate ABC transporter substrate-binding protein [Sulfurimonas sp. RIFCSPLOWO2_12_FULL_34_6]OHE09775.1 MAG: molybdate ABC transporter substrate-binding protein [Sulfurimonas sp. RIFOXYD12_FULL_33_39]OHE13717.1 MAG: molybdate ABC transporter substrate-binding protein [Sulfurimonas sp. RIFOXYD2_FULL_34_21]DAB28068.1 MAG TPA: molybdate ABC transporter substrate-binding protein [Sulfur
MFKYFIFLLFLVFSLEAKNGDRNAVVVFASGNNKFVLPQVIKSFNLLYPDTKIIVEYGATGDLASAILDGVYYDIFFAADMVTPEEIYIAKKSATPAKKYAQGILVLFVPPDKTLGQKKLNILKDKKIIDITVANPKTAPYGKAAIEVLKNTKLFDSLSDKIKYSTDISTVIKNTIWYDAAGFLSKSGIYSLPNAYKTEDLYWIEIEQALYTPIIQGYVVSKAGLENQHVIKFLNFLLSKDGQNIYKINGYK